MLCDHLGTDEPRTILPTYRNERVQNDYNLTVSAVEQKKKKKNHWYIFVSKLNAVNEIHVC